MAPERGRVERAGGPCGVADARESETGGVAAGGRMQRRALTARLLPARSPFALLDCRPLPLPLPGP